MQSPKQSLWSMNPLLLPIDTFKRFIEENKDELTALQIIYGKESNTLLKELNEVLAA